MLQCVAVCCSVLQYVAVLSHTEMTYYRYDQSYLYMQWLIITTTNHSETRHDLSLTEIRWVCWCRWRQLCLLGTSVYVSNNCVRVVSDTCATHITVLLATTLLLLLATTMPHMQTSIICVWVCVFVCEWVCMCVFVRVCACVCVCVYLRVCVTSHIY